MSFPTSPTTGQVHQQQDKLWKFNGTGWQAFKSPVYWFAVEGKPSTFPATPHTHDDRYYTESEIDTLLSTLDAGTY
jgi:hypothetical protein